MRESSSPNSSVTILKLRQRRRVQRAVEIATSAASRPRPSGCARCEDIWRASNANHRPPRKTSNQALSPSGRPGDANIAEIAGAIAGRNVQTATEGDCQVAKSRQTPTRSLTFRCGAVATGEVVTEVDVAHEHSRRSLARAASRHDAAE